MRQDDKSPPAGRIEDLAPGVRRILAPNPSPMTLWGTNTYILGSGDVAVIDPGPQLPAHLEAVMTGLAGERVALILVTHAHLDHSPLAAELSARTGAPVLAHGDWTAGRSAQMTALAASGGVGGGEGVDAGFRPDHALPDGTTVGSDMGWSDAPIEAIWTPGHFSNHMSFAWRGNLFCGDHVMGWASSLVSPPDGDLTAFMDSSRRLLARPEGRYFPGHGAPLDQPEERLRWLIGHREMREAQILEALEAGPANAAELAARIYTDLAPALMGAASRNVLAHLLDLTARNHLAPVATAPGSLTATTRFSHVDRPA
ncbi:MBL fold metallo-hydrolase [Brevirhabdus pacifica]|uniref:MBL fold metallo-hydrolase n=1 Tax=Brevirhabdus pacifica TaxID=1267768 RepID=A0A1U7DEX9_9RHOB|nr:MBL fold metallo-hydrolase [Brevirhabdus pacifica]APX88438.1 MBL fold metallo-hydrolase [Brevirhabdus pacifica]OWU79746.1 metallo-beta-lactamase [Loktanella sp. 22II-4b]PJJ87098.1 glyoxylase-like metal-dependent hydrolase (beta-lactamase superfamily II) [Brevirhabdus pacifica]